MISIIILYTFIFTNNLLYGGFVYYCKLVKDPYLVFYGLAFPIVNHFAWVYFLSDSNRKKYSHFYRVAWEMLIVFGTSLTLFFLSPLQDYLIDGIGIALVTSGILIFRLSMFLPKKKNEHVDNLSEIDT